MTQSLSRGHRHKRDRWPHPGSPVAWRRSAVADVTGQQPAPDGRRGGGTLVLQGDTVQFVDIGTGDFGGDHDSFTELVRRKPGRAIPTPHILRRAVQSDKRIKGRQGRIPMNLRQTGRFTPMDAIDRQLIEALRVNGRSSWAELGRVVGLSGPSVQERVRRLEERGVLLGYRAVVA